MTTISAVAWATERVGSNTKECSTTDSALELRSLKVWVPEIGTRPAA